MFFPLKGVPRIWCTLEWGAGGLLGIKSLHGNLRPGPHRPEGTVELHGPSAKNVRLVGLTLWTACWEMGAVKYAGRGFAESCG